MTSLNLSRFDMSTIASDSVVVMIGKRNTGKSFLCRDLLYHMRDIPVGTVISATEVANGFYGKIMPPLFIHHEYDDSIVEKAIARQQKVIDRTKRNPQRSTDPLIDNRAIFILDDCMYDSSWVKSKHIRSMFCNGRHFKILFLLTMQYALGIPPNLRSNIDYVFILRESIVRNQKILYENFCGMFPNFDIFQQVLNQCTENYECLVINNTTRSNKLEDQVFWYKAEPHDDFKIGAPEIWEYSRRHMDPNEPIPDPVHGDIAEDDVDMEQNFDPKKFMPKQRAHVSVHKAPTPKSAQRFR